MTTSGGHRGASSRPREQQPGGRPPAPGELSLVQSFVNTRWDLDRDHRERFESPRDLALWLSDRGLLESGTTLTEGDLARALEVREGLRDVLFVNNGADPDPDAMERLNRVLGRAELHVAFERSGQPALRPSGSGLDRPFGQIAGIIAAARVDGSWSRLKACPGDHCGWAFYDHSRNRSGGWCSMSLCGSRTKAREYRRRKRSGR